MFAEINKDQLDRLPFVICTLGEQVKQVPVHRPDGFEYHQFIWLASGQGQFICDAKKHTLSAGQGMFFRRQIPHDYEGLADGMHTVWCTFMGADSLLDFYNIADCFLFTVPEFLTPTTAALKAACLDNSNIVTRSAAGYSWLVELLEGLFAPAAPVAVRVLQFLENHYSEPLTLDDIADHTGINRFSLCHCYKREQGITVMEQLKKIRIAKSKQFLRYSVTSVEEIGRLCGFDSPSYFGKRFREETGLSPREYRRLHQK